MEDIIPLLSLNVVVNQITRQVGIKYSLLQQSILNLLIPVAYILTLIQEYRQCNINLHSMDNISNLPFPLMQGTC